MQNIKTENGSFVNNLLHEPISMYTDLIFNTLCKLAFGLVGELLVKD